MTPAEGCDFFGIPNCCRVVMENLPPPPFDPESEALKHLKQVVWSVVGSGGSSRTDAKLGDLEEVLDQARKYPNVTGGVLDDFTMRAAGSFSLRRMSLFSGSGCTRKPGGVLISGSCFMRMRFRRRSSRILRSAMW